MPRSLSLFCLGLLALVPVVRAQGFQTSPCASGEDGGGWFSFGSHACEVRRTTLPLSAGRIGVTGQNGNVEVIGEDRGDILLEAEIKAQAPSHDEAVSLLHEVRIATANDDIHAEGPHTGMGRGWSVNYKLRVPRRVAQMELRTSNGNVAVGGIEGDVQAGSSNGNIRAEHIRGSLRATTTNGSLALRDLGGSVHAQTTNGPVDIALAGGPWHGNELVARSTNGGISFEAPASFAAHLTADTTNGSIEVSFPNTQTGRPGRHVDTELNGGGPPIHLETTNGGIHIGRS